MSEELEDLIIIGRTKKETILPKELCVELTDYIIKLQQEKEETIRQQKELLDKYNKPKKTYVLWIRQYDITVNDYVVREKIVNTHDIYHEIGYIYCNEIIEYPEELLIKN